MARYVGLAGSSYRMKIFNTIIFMMKYMYVIFFVKIGGGGGGGGVPT